VGLDLILPVAAILPFERHIRWVERLQLPQKLVRALLNGAAALAPAMLSKSKFAGPKGLLFNLMGGDAVTDAMKTAARLGGEQLKKMNAESMAKHDYMTAVLTEFRLELDHGEEDRVLLRSRR
jgi:hypothetical protein